VIELSFQEDILPEESKLLSGVREASDSHSDRLVILRLLSLQASPILLLDTVQLLHIISSRLEYLLRWLARRPLRILAIEDLLIDRTLPSSLGLDDFRRLPIRSWSAAGSRGFIPCFGFCVLLRGSQLAHLLLDGFGGAFWSIR
jgi:hypothetical protein